MYYYVKAKKKLINFEILLIINIHRVIRLLKISNLSYPNMKDFLNSEKNYLMRFHFFLKYKNKCFIFEIKYWPIVYT